MTRLVTTPGVQLIAWTHFQPPAGVPWPTAASNGEELAHFAGRACYASWKRPNPATASTEGYIDHILEVGHYSVLEHAQATFYFTRISRGLTHELIRHRHFSYSQLSQRFADSSSQDLVVPPLFAGNKRAEQILEGVGDYTANAYAELLEIAEAAVETADPTSTSARKQAREAARAALPNATDTAIVVTGNIRAWRHFAQLRATAAADREICDLAVAVLLQLRSKYPASFADFVFSEEPDGRTVATAVHAEVS
jgi:thymidylate synthase (FAD)